MIRPRTWSMTTLKRSGPRRSPKGVEPTTSQKSAVTVRRSPSPPARPQDLLGHVGGDEGSQRSHTIARQIGERTAASVTEPGLIRVVLAAGGTAHEALREWETDSWTRGGLPGRASARATSCDDRRAWLRCSA